MSALSCALAECVGSGGQPMVFDPTVNADFWRDRPTFVTGGAGSWHCMDTLRDAKTLEALWQSGTSPWKTW
jgi:glucose-1-phosphate cytidylyltransferase